MSVKEKRALHKLITEKNKIHITNDKDKNLGPTNADKCEVIKECKRQLYDVVTYIKLSAEEVNFFWKSVVLTFEELLISTSTWVIPHKKRKNFLCPTSTTV